MVVAKVSMKAARLCWLRVSLAKTASRRSSVADENSRWCGGCCGGSGGWSRSC